MRTNIIAAGLAAGSLVAAMLMAPILASAVQGFLTIEKAKLSIDDEKLKARLTTDDRIPKDGSGGAFGYGILTNDGNGIVVATSHPGVLDSQKQSYILDPVIHNHFVRLGDVDACGSDPGVLDITWQSPGKVTVSGDVLVMSRIPTDGFEGTHSITGEELDITLGEDVSNVVSFKLAPVFGAGGLEAVCVTDITPAEEFEVEN